jgi:hypothetical protein
MRSPNTIKLDTQLRNYAKRWVVALTVVKGTVNLKGRLETHKSWDTTKNNYTLGKFGASGWFGAYTRGNSHTDEVKLHKLNLLKIADSQFLELIVPSTALADSLKENQRVACIFSADRSRLYYVVNHDTQISVGFLPNWGGLHLGMIICYGIAGISFFTMFSSPQSAFFGFLIGGSLTLMGRIAQLALFRSKEIWAQALTLVQTP